MKKLILTLALLSTTAFAQSVVGIGGSTAAAYATSISGCPVATGNSYFLCIVVPGGTTQPFLALSVGSFNNGAPFQVAAVGLTGPAGPAGPVGATGPAGPQGPPGPAATNPVTSVNGKTGAVVLSVVSSLQ